MTVPVYSSGTALPGTGLPESASLSLVYLRTELLHCNIRECDRARPTTYQWGRLSLPYLEVVFCRQLVAAISFPCVTAYWEPCICSAVTGRFQARLLAVVTHGTKKHEWPIVIYFAQIAIYTLLGAQNLQKSVTGDSKIVICFPICSCHGKQLCDLPLSVTERSFNMNICQKSYGRYMTSILHIKYSCEKGMPANTSFVAKFIHQCNNLSGLLWSFVFLLWNLDMKCPAPKCKGKILFENVSHKILCVLPITLAEMTENIAMLPMQGNLIGTTLQIYSPYYPCFLPSTQFKLQCQLRTER